MHQHMRRCGKTKEKLADFLIQALKQGALGILATVLRVLTSAKKQKQILKEGFKAFSWVFEFRFYDTYEQSYLPFCVPIHFHFKLEQNVREKVYRYLEKRNHKSLHV